MVSSAWDENTQRLVSTRSAKRPMGVIPTPLLSPWPDRGRQLGHPGGYRPVLSGRPDMWTRCHPLRGARSQALAQPEPPDRTRRLTCSPAPAGPPIRLRSGRAVLPSGLHQPQSFQYLTRRIMVVMSTANNDRIPAARGSSDREHVAAPRSHVSPPLHHRRRRGLPAHRPHAAARPSGIGATRTEPAAAFEDRVCSRI